MKMNRDQLKALVKECLLELLSEGLGNVSSARPASLNSSQLPRPISGMAESRSRRRMPDFDPRLDTPVSPARQPTHALKEAIKQNAGGNPLMESIFADTARTTLASQLAHGDVGTPPPGGVSSGASQVVQQEQFHGDPEQVFGADVASRWASLAFMEGPAKKTA